MEAAVDGTMAQADEDLLKILPEDLQILIQNCKPEIHNVKGSHFFFPSNVEEFEPTELTGTETSFLDSFLHVGIVNKETAVEPLKRNQILLTVWPSNIAPAAYGDKTYLGGTKKVHTLIFSVSEELFNKYHDGVTPNEVVAAAAIISKVDDWKFFESKVVAAFFHMRFDGNASLPEENLTTIWEELSTSSWNSVWVQMLFLCCGSHDIGYHVKRMLKRNSARIRRLVQNSEAHDISLEGETISEFKILSTLTEWCRVNTTNIEPLLTTLEEINSTKPILAPKEIMEKINATFANQTDSANSNIIKDIIDTEPILAPKETMRKINATFANQTDSANSNIIKDIIDTKPILAPKEIMEKINATFANQTDSANSNIIKDIIDTKPILAPKEIMEKRSAAVASQTRSANSKRLKDINDTKPILTSKENMEKISAAVASETGSPNNKKLKCTQCPYQCKFPYHLTNHMRSHTGERPFACEVCSATFTQRGSLSQHMARHKSVPDFECNICGHPFTARRHLMVHMASHQKKGTFEYNCYACKKEFLNEGALNKHMPSHHNEPRYECNICPEKFVNSMDLREHKDLHNVKRHRCNQCEKTFTTKGNLQKHMNFHDPERNFGCDHCEMTFKTNEIRLRHMLLKHEPEPKLDKRMGLKRSFAQPRLNGWLNGKRSFAQSTLNGWLNGIREKKAKAGK